MSNHMNFVLQMLTIDNKIHDIASNKEKTSFYIENLCQQCLKNSDIKRKIVFQVQLTLSIYGIKVRMIVYRPNILQVRSI